MDASVHRPARPEEDHEEMYLWREEKRKERKERGEEGMVCFTVVLDFQFWFQFWVEMVEGATCSGSGWWWLANGCGTNFQPTKHETVLVRKLKNKFSNQ